MNKNNEFNNLASKYSNYTELERNAYLIYKSSFFNLINRLSSIPNFIDIDDNLLVEFVGKESFDVCRKFGNVLGRKNNIFVKYSLFKDVDFSDNLSLIRFAKRVYNNLENSFSKIVTEKDIQVYRLISVDDLDHVEDLSQGAFISTSLDKNQTLNFLDNDARKIVFYKINIEAGVPVVVSPYSIVNEYDSLSDMIFSTENYSIKIKNNESNGQQEVLLLKNSLDYNVRLDKVQKIDDQEFYFYEVNAKAKNNRKNYF